jgi:hypothetical protein
MVEWLGQTGVEMRVAFSKVFGSRHRPFGSPSTQVGGLSDGKEGVQWNVAYDRRDGRQAVGVNLEGMQYDDWPVARLIERELKQPTLLPLVRMHPGLSPVVLLWRRDYWQAASRPEIEERYIHPTPIALGDLTDEGWRRALEAAIECLDAKRKRRGRAIQTVTLQSGRRVEGEVSPHLTFEYRAEVPVGWDELCRSARDTLQPLHDWARQRAGQLVSF